MKRRPAAGMSPEERRRFAEENKTLTARRLNVTLALAALGLGGFSALDFIVARERFIHLAGIRLWAIVGLGVIYFLGGRDKSHRWVDGRGVFAFLWMAVSVQTLVLETGGHASTYYAGLNLIIVGVGILMPWSGTRTLSVLLGIEAIYNASILWTDVITNVDAYATNNFFLLFTGVIAWAGTIAQYLVRRRESLASQRLDAANGELRSLDQFRKDFIGNLSHEMRTPLTLALAPVESLLEDPRRTKEEIELLKVVQTSALSLLSLINDLLSLQRIDAAMERLHPDRIDARELLSSLAAMARVFAERKGVDLEVLIGEGETSFVADREKVERTLMNLLSNALKFVPADSGKIVLSCIPDESCLRFSVADNGIGIPDSEREHVFQRFRQVETGPARRYGGTGIGLSLVREFVEMHGGKVWIEGREGGGTVFHVELMRTLDHVPPETVDRRGPRASSTEGGPGRRRDSDRGVSAFANAIAANSDYRTIQLAQVSERRAGIRTDEARHSGRILIVDDTPDVLRILSVQLYGVHQVIHARSGKEALEMARKWRPSLIISDMMMPEMDGTELCRRLNDDEDTANIPVILLTARVDDEARLLAKKSGAVVYMTKPWTRAELLATIDALLRKRAHSARSAARYETRTTALVAEGIAHELRNPLGFVMNAQFIMGEVASQAIDAAGDQIDAGKKKSLLEMLEEARGSGEQGILRIRQMIDQVASLGEHGPGLQGESDPATVAAEVQQLVRPRLEGRELQLEVESTLAAIAPGRLHQVVLNLVKNAVEAVSPGGKIQVVGKTEGDIYVLRVIDDGPGIPAESRDAVFQPFFTTKPPGQGSGLGLAISRSIVTEALGTLELAEGEPNTTFVLRVPLLSRQEMPSQVA